MQSGKCEGFIPGTKVSHFDKDKYQFCDERDGTRYVYVDIGEQTWMAENLKYNVEGSKCYGDNTGGDSQNKCDTYGRLYDWETAMDVCPTDWRLPSEDDWDAMTAYIEDNKDCNSCDSKHLKTNDWLGLDSYGFSALPGGYVYPDFIDDFYDVGNRGLWWSTKNNNNIVYGRGMSYDDDSNWHSGNKSGVFASVRCIQDKNQ